MHTVRSKCCTILHALIPGCQGVTWPNIICLYVCCTWIYVPRLSTGLVRTIWKQALCDISEIGDVIQMTRNQSTSEDNFAPSLFSEWVRSALSTMGSKTPTWLIDACNADISAQTCSPANVDWVKSIINTCLHKHFKLYKYVSFFFSFDDHRYWRAKRNKGRPGPTR